ncbi:SOS response-associated peptidase family protein [Arthrobacter sp. CAN_A214]|uniref:SOS response-associated peptidase family protein n=1 Tax=Arthrobacter sp. CAN_A214 TaxID=2787720 RepID=UPI002FF292AB
MGSDRDDFHHSGHRRLGGIHERFPVIIPKELQGQWLDPTMTDKDQIQHFLTAVPESVLIPRIVGKDVGSVRNDGPQLIQPVG